MTVKVMEIGTYQIEQNDYMEKPIKFTVIPGEVSSINSYCVLDGYSSAPTVNVATTLYYICYLRDSYSNEIPINNFIQNMNLLAQWIKHGHLPVAIRQL